MKKVTIIRYRDDPVCPRVSAGGGEEIGGYYCTYRGTREEAIEMLKTILLVMEHMPEQPVDPEMLLPPEGGQFSN
jgi:hypothetical protein